MKNSLPILFSFVLFFSGCSQYDKILPELSFKNDNALLPTITFKTSKVGDVYIEYWPDDNSNRRQRSKVSNGQNHSLTLFNLKPSTKYNYVVRNISVNSTSEEFSFMTSALPAEMLKVEKVLIDSAQFDGYVLVRMLSEFSADVLIDKEGDIVWYNAYDTIVRRSFIWTQKNTLLSGYDTARIVEYDIYNNKILDIDLGKIGVGNSIHHEVIFNDQDEVVALTLDSMKMDLRKIGGNEDQYIRADGIIRFDKKGKKLWEWNLLDVYDPIVEFKGTYNPKQSLGHANSLTIDTDGHYLISFRDFDQIWKVNSEDGAVIWKLGKDGDFNMDMNNYFIAQHSIYFNTLGELVLFDNGNKERPNSRVLSFRLDDKAMNANISTHISLPTELSASKMCSAEMIEEGKYLVCNSSNKGTIAIVNERAEILWRVDLSHPSYRAYYLKNPFEGVQ